MSTWTLKTSGALKTSFQISENASIHDLRVKIAEIAGVFGPKLVIKGKIHTETDKNLQEKSIKSIKLKNNGLIIIVPRNAKEKKLMKEFFASSKQTKEIVKEKLQLEKLMETESKPSIFAKKKKSQVEIAHERNLKLQEIFEAAQTVASRNGEGLNWDKNQHFVLQNQFGKDIYLPEKDRQCITLGLTLVAKAESIRNNSNDLRSALEIYKYCDQVFDKLELKYKTSISNIPDVSLNVVWLMYLCHDLDPLPDSASAIETLNHKRSLALAWKTLCKAEEGYNHVHGKKMERLLKIQGNTFCPQIYGKMYFLFAYAAYIQGAKHQAKEYLSKANIEIKRSKVNSEQLAALMNMGYSEKLARRGMKFCQREISDEKEGIAFVTDLPNVISWIDKKQEAIRKRKQQEKELHERKMAEKRLGKIENGKEYVNLKAYNTLLSMGYNDQIAQYGLQKSNNSIDGFLKLMADPKQAQEFVQQIETQIAQKVQEDIELIKALMDSGIPHLHALVTATQFKTFEKALLGYEKFSNSKKFKNILAVFEHYLLLDMGIVKIDNYADHYLKNYYITRNIGLLEPEFAEKDENLDVTEQTEEVPHIQEEIQEDHEPEIANEEENLVEHKKEEAASKFLDELQEEEALSDDPDSYLDVELIQEENAITTLEKMMSS